MTTDALLSSVRHALGVLYGPGVASKNDRRLAEAELLVLRKADAISAMGVCVQLLKADNVPSAMFAAQTITHLCRYGDADASWPELVRSPRWIDSVLELLRSAADQGHPKAVITSLGLGVCALFARKRGWGGNATWGGFSLVSCVLHGLGAVESDATPRRAYAAVLLFSLLPEELESDQLALVEPQVEECKAELAALAAPSLVTEVLLPALGAPATAPVALGCLASWVKGEIIPWATLSTAMDAAIAVIAASLSMRDGAGTAG